MNHQRALSPVTVALLGLLLSALLAGRGEALTVYANDFQGAVGAEWSSASTEATPAPGDGSRKFLGRFADGTVTLALSGLPAHSEVAVTFDLYIIQSWDGDGPEGGTPDIWTLGVGGGPTLLHTTFSNFPGRTQDYPGTYDDVPDGATNAPKSGASESDTLGYGGFADFPGGDAVYHLSFAFPHSGSSLVLNFNGGPGLTSVADESWGLDNLTVEVRGDTEARVPAPAVLGLVAVGLPLLLLARSRRGPLARRVGKEGPGPHQRA